MESLVIAIMNDVSEHVSRVIGRPVERTIATLHSDALSDGGGGGGRTQLRLSFDYYAQRRLEYNKE